MKHLINILWIGTCLFLSLSCSKNAVDLKDSEFGFDPIAEPSATLRNLHVNAIFFEEEPPVSDTAKGLRWTFALTSKTFLSDIVCDIFY
jgi:hypothetical protein